MMATVRLRDGRVVGCLRRHEALAIDQHVEGYLRHGITVGPGAVVLDVGANIGLFALRIAERCGGDATVLAFEPIPPIYAVLERNAAALPDAIRPIPCAVGREPGTAEFTFFPNSPALSTAHPEIWRDDPAQLELAVRGGARAGSASSLLRWLPGPLCRLVARHLVRGATTVSCEITTVSKVILEHGLDRVDLLKVDVEGAELEVLEGVASESWPRIRQVVVEVHDVDGRLDSVVRLLEGAGLTEITTEQEPSFRGTVLHNVFALRPGPSP